MFPDRSFALRTAAVVLLIANAALAVPARAAGGSLTVTLDGSELGTIARSRDDQTDVALVPLARAAHWRCERRTRAVVLSGDDRVVELVVGSRAVREDGEPVAALRAPLFERAGVLYLAASDAARLFALHLAPSRSAIAFEHAARIDGAAVIDEVAKPSPRPRPSVAPARATASASATPSGPADAGRILVSFERTAGVQMFRLSAEGRTGVVQSSFDASGIDRFGMPNATVQVGTAERGAAVGLMGDPLSGDVVGGGVFNGIELRRLDLGRAYFTGRRLDGLFESGVTFGEPSAGATTVAFVRDAAGVDDLVARREKRWHHAWGDFTAETMASERGFGIGAGARTSGRTFLESHVTLERGLPVGPNEQPLTLDVGRHLSEATTIAGGAGTSGNGALLPFAAVSTRAGAMTASLSLANRSLTTSIAAATPAGSLQAYASGGAAPMLGVAGELTVRGVAVDINATSSAGTRDAQLVLRSTRTAVGAIAGVALDGGRFGPVVGLSIPVTPLIALEGTVRAAGPGGRSTRLAFAMRVPHAQPRAPRTVVATVHLDADGIAPGALRLLVDGVPARVANASALHAQVTPGTHTFSVESTDGAFGSPPVTQTLSGPAVITLPLWPQRAVAGRVRPADPQSVPADVALSGIVVTIAPGDATAVTDADGRFFFGKQAFPPDARVAVDPDTLPQELRALDATPLPAGDVDLALPGRTVEAQRFPAAQVKRSGRRRPPARHR
ncbi:MAG TPA: hypothetical protein VHT53_08035 [Candidatus Elarobacter sp.]|jgi:hypothetical protein|nr:hypothetical protein [Candidatus Elarobacter sp.]